MASFEVLAGSSSSVHHSLLAPRHPSLSPHGRQDGKIPRAGPPICSATVLAYAFLVLLELACGNGDFLWSNVRISFEIIHYIWHLQRLDPRLSPFLTFTSYTLRAQTANHILNGRRVPSFYRSSKKHHLVHHYQNPESSFGVTTAFFDIVFGTGV